VSPGIKSFGYSLSRGLDMDFNGYLGEVLKLRKLRTLPNIHLVADGMIARSVVLSSIQIT